MNLFQNCPNCGKKNLIKVVHDQKIPNGYLDLKFFANCGKCGGRIWISSFHDYGIAEMFAKNLQNKFNVRIEFLNGDPIGLPGEPGETETIVDAI